MNGYYAEMKTHHLEYELKKISKTIANQAKNIGMQ